MLCNKFINTLSINTLWESSIKDRGKTVITYPWVILKNNSLLLSQGIYWGLLTRQFLVWHKNHRVSMKTILLSMRKFINWETTIQLKALACNGSCSNRRVSLIWHFFYFVTKVKFTVTVKVEILFFFKWNTGKQHIAANLSICFIFSDSFRLNTQTSSGRFNWTRWYMELVLYLGKLQSKYHLPTRVSTSPPQNTTWKIWPIWW